MAITNAQQYQQLVNKPAGNKRPGYRGDKAYGSQSEQAKSFSKATSTKNLGAPTQTKDEKAGGTQGDAFRRSKREFDQKLARDNARRNQTKTKVTKKTKKDKTKKKRNFIQEYINNRLGLAYNVVPSNPQLSYQYIDQLKKEDYEDLPQSLKDRFEELTQGYEIESGQTNLKDLDKLPYDEYSFLRDNTDFDQYAYDRGKPGLLLSGNVGGLGDRFVKKDPITGETLKDQYGQTLYGYSDVRGDGEGSNLLPPVIAQAPSIPEPTGYVNPLSLLTPRIAGTRFLGTEFEDDTESAADGGRIGAMGGGIMNTDVMGGLADGGMDESGRQMYFLGKLVKKATRAIKKITKSPIGKAALLGGGLGLAGIGPFKGLAKYGLMAKNFAANKLLGPAMDYGRGTGGLFDLIKANPMKSIFAASTLAGLMTPKEEDDEFDIDAYYAANRLNSNAPLNRRILGTDFYAADGGMPSKEPVAKKTMPLLDMDGQEMDLRAEGGFVPLGRMERADDVPARLSKNEFVFTADAVRNAGEGDIDKGAEVMYNMMKNLESGGEVSEESQGLEGAREMFQTSQRLEEVI